MKYGAILLAAGKGTRYKGTKQDVLFHNKPLWRYAYETALEIITEDYIVVVGKNIKGGETRTGSVLNGLRALPKDTDRVIIVEAARPMVTKDQMLQLLTDNHVSVSFVRPLVNTVIYRDGKYINREELYDLLTPQSFPGPHWSRKKVYFILDGCRRSLINFIKEVFLQSWLHRQVQDPNGWQTSIRRYFV